MSWRKTFSSSRLCVKSSKDFPRRRPNSTFLSNLKWRKESPHLNTITFLVSSCWSSFSRRVSVFFGVCLSLCPILGFFSLFLFVVKSWLVFETRALGSILEKDTFFVGQYRHLAQVFGCHFSPRTERKEPFSCPALTSSAILRQPLEPRPFLSLRIVVSVHYCPFPTIDGIYSHKSFNCSH